MSGLEIVPITIKDACTYVKQVHRHHRAPNGGLFAVAVAKDERVVAVAIVATPVARLLCDGWTAEVTRLASDGTKNACSALYSAAWRAARALGYRKLITYVLKEESGTSVNAAGWRCVGECGGGTWNRKDRPRVDDHPMQMKIKWERVA